VGGGGGGGSGEQGEWRDSVLLLSSLPSLAELYNCIQVHNKFSSQYKFTTISVQGLATRCLLPNNDTTSNSLTEQGHRIGG